MNVLAKPENGGRGDVASALAWSQAFSYFMPLPDAQEIEVVEAVSRRPGVPEIG
jgi:hypothetical protein